MGVDPPPPGGGGRWVFKKKWLGVLEGGFVPGKNAPVWLGSWAVGFEGISSGLVPSFLFCVVAPLPVSTA